MGQRQPDAAERRPGGGFGNPCNYIKSRLLVDKPFTFLLIQRLIRTPAEELRRRA
ncbi:hypothetical protein RND71_018604 [Anisodus tanguticus]|uniref:Uncharacterized protein n=1 Tax=Anisodus tanguticus TaxID=243964 RepID=A0AAE1S5Z9_9SOLA|nr:hypothetical protein RND71_018604 [Anisodus tanguticus]